MGQLCLDRNERYLLRYWAKKEIFMDWIQFATFMIGNIAFTLTLWLWNRAESNSDRREIMALIKSISEEMKDFHGRLERQDAEFRTRFLALEERKIKIFEK
jgi:hypothetical protein